MARKKSDAPSPVRLAINNADLAKPAPDHGGDSGTPRHQPPPLLPPDCPVKASRPREAVENRVAVSRVLACGFIGAACGQSKSLK
jgi:hypothetical protein